MSKLSFITAVFLFAGTLLADQFVTSGAAVTTDGDAEIYTWTTTNETGMIVVPEGGALFDILLVGGGGAGGFHRGGGGGGGGVIYQKSVFFPEGTYSISVGAGGVPDMWEKSSRYYAWTYPASTPATDGGCSVISNATEAFRTVLGGGGGGNGLEHWQGRTGGSAGGSGGGSSDGEGSTSRTEGTPGQGNSGGCQGSAQNFYSGGGGGAGEPGADAKNSNSGKGGDGLSIDISGTPVLYGAGGGGGCSAGSGSGAGGAGGGGHGGSGSNLDRTAGQDGVGAGGGGGSGANNDYYNNGGACGGSGIVIMRTAGAALPEAKDFNAVVTGTRTVTFSGTLVGVGTNPDGSEPATSCSIYLAYGVDPENLVSECVKNDWTSVNPAWSMTIQDLGVDYTRFYWTVAVSNDLGVAVEETFEGSFQTTGTLTAVPLKAKFMDSAQTAAPSGNQLGDAFALADGTTTYYTDFGNESIVPDVLFDAGEAKIVKMMRTRMPPSVAAAKAEGRMAGFELYGSNDAVAWTKLADRSDILVDVILPEVWMETLLADEGPFRYFKLSGVKALSLQEVELLSPNMGIRAKNPEFLASTDPEAADAADGVTVAGTLTYSPSSETEVYGYYAETDYDADESAWAANGTKFSFDGVYKTGDTFSRKVKIGGSGERFIRLFAKADEMKTSSHRTWTVALRAKVKIVPAYYTGRGETFYDALFAYQNADISESASIIFDLRGLKPREELSYIRFWPRVGGQTYFRARKGIIEVSYEDVVVEHGAESTVEGREVYSYTRVADSKSFNWKTAHNNLDELPLSSTAASGVQFLNLPADGRRPTFLRIRNFGNGNMNEAELRVVAPPPGLKVLLR